MKRPTCEKCSELFGNMQRVYTGKRSITKNGNTTYKQIAIGWLCMNCRTVVFTI